MNTFNNTKTQSSVAALINRAILGAFTFALVGSAGVMTFANFMTTI